MAKVINLFNSLDQNNQQCDFFIRNILTSNSDLPINKQEIDSILNSTISLINTRLNQAVTRSQGFTLLIDIVSICSKDALIKYVPLWITKVTQVLESTQSTIKDITLACQALSALIVPCKEIPELQKQISMQTVKQVIFLISNLELNNRCGATLHLIATMLYYYKEPTEKLQSTIRKIILPLIDSDKKNLVNAGAKCNALLARATERSFKPVSNKPTYTCWVHNQALIINSLHFIMDELFSGILQLDSVDIWAHLELPEISDENVIDYYAGLEKRFENLCTYLITMLRGCAGKNSTSPTDILKVLCRGLAISPENLQNNSSFKNQLLLLSLPKIHVNLLMILNSLIVGFRQELVPYTVTILKLYRQTLKWTEKVDSTNETISGSKAFKNVRIAVYQSLSCWLTNMGPLSGIDIMAEDILHYVFIDLTPEKNEISLIIQKNQNVSKRVARQLRNSQYENSAALGNATTETKNPLVNSELCQAALLTLQHIFNNSGCLLKPTIYKATQQLIVPILYDLYIGVDKKSFYVKSEKCRLNLLKVLQVLQMNPHPLTPPPTQYATEIFSMALHDNSTVIVEEAKMSLFGLEKMIHPSGPTLNLLPSKPQDEEENLTKKRPLRETLDRVQDILKGVQELEAQNEKIVDNEDTNIIVEKEIGIENMDTSDGPTMSKQQKLQIIESIPISKETVIENNKVSSLTDDDDSFKSLDEDPEVIDEPKKSLDNVVNINKNEEILEPFVTEPKKSLDTVINSNEDEEMLGLFVDEVKTY